MCLVLFNDSFLKENYNLLKPVTYFRSNDNTVPTKVIEISEHHNIAENGLTW